MKKTQILRIFIFSTLLIGLLFSNLGATEFQAKPLYDAGLNISKTASPTVFSEAGEIITYTIVIKNTSQYSLSEISVKDDLIDISCPSYSGLSQRTEANGRYGGTITCTGIYTITEDDISAGEAIVNSASVNAKYVISSGCGGGTEYAPSASASATVTYEPIPIPDIALTKNASVEFFTEVGEEITYTYVVENRGNGPAEGQLIVKDDRIDSILCPQMMGGAIIQSGKSVECKGIYTTTEEDVAAGSITNQATASVGDATASASLTIEYKSSPALELKKSASPTFFTKSGDLIVYTFTVTNTGNALITSPFMIYDAILDDWECPTEATLAPGENLTCMGYYSVRESDIGKTLKNCAIISGKYENSGIASPFACTDTYYEAPQEKKPPADDVES